MNERILLAILLVMIGFTLTWAQNFKFVCDEWEPYQYEKDNKTIGVSAEIIREVFKRMDSQVPEKIDTYPWARAEKMLIDGEADILFTAVYSPERAKLAKYPTEPLLESGWSLFVLKDSINKYNSLEDLKGKVVGGVNKYAYPDKWMEYVKKNGTLQLVSNDTLNIRKLLIGGRVDYIVMDSLNGVALLKSMSAYDQVTMLPKNVEITKLYIVFNNKISNDIIDKYDKTLREFKSTEEYQTIVNKYK